MIERMEKYEPTAPKAGLEETMERTKLYLGDLKMCREDLKADIRQSRELAASYSEQKLAIEERESQTKRASGWNRKMLRWVLMQDCPEYKNAAKQMESLVAGLARKCKAYSAIDSEYHEISSRYNLVERLIGGARPNPIIDFVQNPYTSMTVSLPENRPAEQRDYSHTA